MIGKLLAKMYCAHVTNFGNSNIEANLQAVTGNSEENKTFSKYTPSASLKMAVNNPDANGFYEPGYEYLITIEKLPKV